MERLNDFLRKYDKIAIALSGGADSACLLKACLLYTSDAADD